MSRQHRRAVPTPVAAVAIVAGQAQHATGRPMPDAELCELLTRAREMEIHRLLEQGGVPYVGPPRAQRLPVGRIRWSPGAFAALRGLTGAAAEMFTEIATALAAQPSPTPDTEVTSPLRRKG